MEILNNIPLYNIAMLEIILGEIPFVKSTLWTHYM